MTKYHTIVADPPWPYRSRDGGMLRSSLEHRPNSGGGSRAMGVGVVRRYPVLSMADLEALPVAGLAEANAHLYLWTTNAFMAEAHKLARAWGFEQKTILTWGKVQKDGRASMKTGYYFRGATEHILFCVRGSLPTTGTWPTLFLWPRTSGHSAKPEHFYDLVEQASPGPRLELFARRHRLGWDVWGDESANTAQLDVNTFEGLDMTEKCSYCGLREATWCEILCSDCASLTPDELALFKRTGSHPRVGSELRRQQFRAGISISTHRFTPGWRGHEDRCDFNGCSWYAENHVADRTTPDERHAYNPFRGQGAFTKPNRRFTMLVEKVLHGPRLIL